MRKGLNAPHRGGTIYTLAQLGTTFVQESLNKEVAIIMGEGSPTVSDALVRRAKRKLISQIMVLNLIAIAEQRGQIDKLQPFWNTWHCQNKLYTYKDRYYGKYCKNRFCTLCCSIRKAGLINKYYPILSQWQDAQFLTLTISAVRKDKLKATIKKMKMVFSRIVSKYRKREARGKGRRLVGTYSFECEFNPKARTYNPHIHIITQDLEIARTLVNEWLAAWPFRTDGLWCSKHGQKIKPVENTEAALIEVIKYGSKIFTDPDVEKKSRSKGNRTIYAAALYNIFDALKPFRIFDSFGFNVPKSEAKQPKGARVITDVNEWVFSLKDKDWINTQNELVLSCFKPGDELMDILRNNVDTYSE